MITIFNGRRRSIEGASEAIYVQLDVAMRQNVNLFMNGGNLNAFAVFMVIALHADLNGWAYPSFKTLKNETGLATDEAVSNALKHLRAMTINGKRVLEHYRCKVKGRWDRSYYHIFPELGGEFPTIEGVMSLWTPSAEDEKPSQAGQGMVEPPPVGPGMARPAMAGQGVKYNQSLKDNHNQVEPKTSDAKGASGGDEDVPPSGTDFPLKGVEPFEYYVLAGTSSKAQNAISESCYERCGGMVGVKDDWCPKCGWPIRWVGSSVYNARKKKEHQDKQAKEDPLILEVQNLALAYPTLGKLNLYDFKKETYRARQLHGDSGEGLLSVAQRLKTQMDTEDRRHTGPEFLSRLKNLYIAQGPDALKDWRKPSRVQTPHLHPENVTVQEAEISPELLALAEAELSQ